MPRKISTLAQVDPRAEIADGVEIGPFCYVGPDVTIGADCRLDSHVTIVGQARIGERNRFFPNSVIGGEPQDLGYQNAPTSVEIGHDNVFREGVTVNRGAEKEDHVTRIGNRNYFMANSHVAHNCRVFDGTVLCNGVLLAGHVHVQDGAIISGNSVVHHFATIGTLAFVSGGCRAPQDVPPYMLAAGSDNPHLVTINLVGMRRRGISEHTIRLIRQAHKLLFRDHRSVDSARNLFRSQLEDVIPLELENLLTFVEATQRGKNGRAREIYRHSAPASEHNESQEQSRRAA